MGRHAEIHVIESVSGHLGRRWNVPLTSLLRSNGLDVPDSYYPYPLLLFYILRYLFVPYDNGVEGKECSQVPLSDVVIAPLLSKYFFCFFWLFFLS